MTPHPPGRPRVYEEEAIQLKTRMEKSEAEELLSELKAEGETITHVIAEALRLVLALRRRAKLNCKVTIAALTFAGGSSVEAAPLSELPAPPPVVEVAPVEPTPPQSDLWTPITQALEERVDPKNFETWLSSVRFHSSQEHTITLIAPNPFFQEYLTGHYTDVIEEQFALHYDQVFEVEFIAQDQPAEEPPKPEPPPRPPTPREEIATNIQRLSAEIPEPVLKEDRTLLELRTEILQNESLNREAIGVSNKLSVLYAKLIDRLSQLRAKLPRAKKPEKVSPKPARNDRPWPR